MQNKVQLIGNVVGNPVVKKGSVCLKIKVKDVINPIELRSENPAIIKIVKNYILDKTEVCLEGKLNFDENTSFVELSEILLLGK